MIQKLPILKSSKVPEVRGGSSLLKFDKGKFIIIGGAGRNLKDPLKMVEYNDIWILSLPHSKETQLIGIWTQVVDIKNQELYTSRSGQNATIGNDNKIYIFGGQKFQKDQSTNEFFSLAMEQKELILEKGQIEARNSHILCSCQDSLIVMGGANENGPLNDCWRYWIEKKEWQKVNIDKIDGREIHSGHMINEKELVVIGGRCKENVLKEVLIINIENGKVEKLCELEEELCAHSSVMVDENRIVVIGGFNKNGFSKNLYRIDIKERQCKKLESQLEEGMIAMSSVVDKELGTIILFGGSKMEGESNDLYYIKMNEL